MLGKKSQNKKKKILYRLIKFFSSLNYIYLFFHLKQILLWNRKVQKIKYENCIILNNYFAQFNKRAVIFIKEH